MTAQSSGNLSTFSRDATNFATTEAAINSFESRTARRRTFRPCVRSRTFPAARDMNASTRPGRVARSRCRAGSAARRRERVRLEGWPAIFLEPAAAGTGATVIRYPGLSGLGRPSAISKELCVRRCSAICSGHVRAREHSSSRSVCRTSRNPTNGDPQSTSRISARNADILRALRLRRRRRDSHFRDYSRPLAASLHLQIGNLQFGPELEVEVSCPARSPDRTSAHRARSLFIRELTGNFRGSNGQNPAPESAFYAGFYCIKRHSWICSALKITGNFKPGNREFLRGNREFFRNIREALASIHFSHICLERRCSNLFSSADLLVRRGRRRAKASGVRGMARRSPGNSKYSWLLVLTIVNPFARED